MLMDQDRKMTTQVIDWKNEIGTIAGQFRPGDTKDSWLGRAHKAIREINKKITLRHVRSIYYGHVSDPKYSVASSILSAADQARIEEARRDAAKLADIYQSTAQALGNVDPDFHRSNIDALVNAARILGSLDSPGT
jgi:hypothetical protein